MAQDQPSGTDFEAVGGKGMSAAQVAKKPTVEYNGYQRTITDVIRIRQAEEGDDPADVNTLMEGLDDAIKKCRSLRVRLERIHKRKQTGYHHKLEQPEPA